MFFKKSQTYGYKAVLSDYSLVVLIIRYTTKQ